MTISAGIESPPWSSAFSVLQRDDFSSTPQASSNEAAAARSLSARFASKRRLVAASAFTLIAEPVAEGCTPVQFPAALARGCNPVVAETMNFAIDLDL